MGSLPKAAAQSWDSKFGDGGFPWNRDRHARLVEARPIGDVVLLRYALSPRFDEA